MARTRLILAALLLAFLAGAVVMQHRPAPKATPVVEKPKVPWNGAPVTQDFAVPVLMYHRVCDLTPREARSPLMCDLTVSPADFEAQIKYLAEHGFTFVSVEEIQRAIINGTPLPEKAVAITMDDGYQDNFTHAFPILQKYGAAGTVFLVTGVVGDGNHLKWDEAKQMAQGGVSMQSHTVHHYDLATLEGATLHDELATSRRTIEEKLDVSVEQLAYPSGSYNDRAIAAMRETGYRIGWKKGGGPVMPGCDPYLLPRIRVHGRTDMDDFERKVMSGIWAIRMARAKAAERGS